MYYKGLVIRKPMLHFLLWLCVGLFATLSMDIWGLILYYVFDVPLPNYGIIGRYLLTIPEHGLIATDLTHIAPIAHEYLVGWCIHITVGLVDAWLYMLLIFTILKTKPHLLISLIFGWAMMFMPMLIEQPALGFGVAGSATADPTITRIITLSYHTVFGSCLYLSSCLFHYLFKIIQTDHGTKPRKK